MTFILFPNGPSPISLKLSMSHSRWNRKRSLGTGRCSRWCGWVNWVYLGRKGP